MVDLVSKAPERRKVKGQSFWDANPCGGDWSRYVDFLAWIQHTEPYAFEIVDRYDWADNCVLDVGCGQGTLLNYLPCLGAEVFGLDMSLKSLRRAASGADELGYSDCVHLSAADAECLPFPDAGFDAVLSFGVLHHTPDTCRGVRELHRMLKPGGLAIVMLYRSGNPKWWMTCLIRGFSQLADLWTGEDRVTADRLRAQHEIDDKRGTALLELFGVPILKAFSNRQAYGMFKTFSQVQISNHQPGFRRMADIVPGLKLIEPFLRWFDQRVRNMWGFYQVIEARK
jgi:SAM-dependent methyltransferase